MVKKLLQKTSIIALLIFILPNTVFAMHIMEGYLPVEWSIIWGVIALPFVLFGLRSIQKKVNLNPKLKMLLGLAGAFTFVLSALKLPSVTGSCSHPTGIGLGAILFGGPTMAVIGCIVLIFQAVLLAHGGLTTLGANTFSMAIVGAFVSYFIYKFVQKLGGKQWLAVFLAAALGDLCTYVTTSVQLALAFPAQAGGFAASLTKFMGIFAVTQIPLAISEGILTVIIFNILTTYSSDELKALSIFSKGESA